MKYYPYYIKSSNVRSIINVLEKFAKQYGDDTKVILDCKGHWYNLKAKDIECIGENSGCSELIQINFKESED